MSRRSPRYLVAAVIVDDRVIVGEDGSRLRLEVGDTVTHAQLVAWGQSDEDIENLLADKALEEKP